MPRVRGLGEEMVTYRQFVLHADGGFELTCWLKDSPRLMRGVRLTLKDDPHPPRMVYLGTLCDDVRRAPGAQVAGGRAAVNLDFSRCRPVPLADGTMSGVKEHVKVGVRALCEHSYFFLTDEMGAMKSAQVIIAAQFLFEAGVIDKVLVVAPASVRGVWFDPELGELQKHLFVQSSVTEYHARIRDWLFTSPDITKQVKKLEWIVTNYEFIASKKRLDDLLPFCTSKTLLVLDESAYVKTYDSARTKACFQLRAKCGRVVLLNGTPIAHSPLDLFSQGNMLHPSVHGLKYITHFKSHYAVEQAVVGASGRALHSPRGREIRTIVGWRDLDKLTAKFAPYVLRRLKRDCLDLPEALPPVTYEVPLTEATWKIYKDMRDEMVTWLKSGDVAVSSTAAIKALRLSQITSGFLGGIEDAGVEEQDNSAVLDQLVLGVNDGSAADLDLVDSDGTRRVGSDSLRSNPPPRPLSTSQAIGREKLDFVLGLHREWLDADPNLKLIVWCRFRAELERMMRDIRCATLRYPVMIGEIHGGQKRTDRESALRLLDPRTAPLGPVFFGGTYGTGALGINLTAAHTVINMSFDYSLWKAQQTAARVDRPGQVHAVNYFDVVATGPKGQKTIDHAIIAARRAREDVATWTTSRWLAAITEE